MPVSTAAVPNQSSGGTAQTTQSTNQTQPPAVVVPFVRASAEHTEAISDVSLPITGAVQNLNNIMVPAYGYLRYVWVLVEATGGVSTPAAVFAEDGPLNALLNVMLTEPNGAIIAQFNNTYDMYLADKYGGYAGGVWDPKLFYYSANTANGNFTWMLRIPVELLERDGLGSLPNQNSGAMFQIRMQLNSSAGIYATAPATTLPTVRIRTYAEEWDQPAPSGPEGTNQTTPPSMNTTQFWTPQIYPVNSGNQTIRLTRVGNYIRNLLFIFRANTRAAGDTNWPDLTTIFVDARPRAYKQKMIWRNKMGRRTGYSFGALDTAANQDSGVFLFDFTHEFHGLLGHENRDNWEGTLGSTRLEIQGVFGAAGTLTVLTNDVSVASNVFM